MIAIFLILISRMSAPEASDVRSLQGPTIPLAVPPHSVDLDNTTLAGPGHFATIPRASLRSGSSLPLRPRSITPWASANLQAGPQFRETRANAQAQDASDRWNALFGEPIPATSQDVSLDDSSGTLNRRDVLLGLAAGVASLALPIGGPAQAVQGYTAGRIPGMSPSDQEGFQRYTRPDGKQGGHGVGWSEIPPYTFLLPEGWEEVPVSIADLGGTEVDGRFKSEKQGDLAVVLAPVLRFADVGFNADIRIDDLGSPAKMISGFGPEIMQQNVDDLVESTNVRKTDGLTYYDYELSGHVLISMTALKNRVYIVAVRPKDSTQWRRHSDAFRTMAQSFRALPTPISAVAAGSHRGEYIGDSYLSGFCLMASVALAMLGLTTLRKSQVLGRRFQEPLMVA